MTTKSVQIIPTTEADLPAIAALADCIWRLHYPGIISPAQIDYMLDRMYQLPVLEDEVRSQGIRFELLRVDGQPAGFGSFGPIAEAGVTKLHKLYLHPKHHGCGLGSRLLQHCETEARNAGATRLILAVNKRNTKAIAAYVHNGYIIERTVINDIGGGFVMDDFIMSKHLKS